MSLARRGVWLCQCLYHRNIRRMEECDTLLAWLDPRPGENILDVGCGDGFHDARITARGAAVVGIDIHESRLTFARRHNSGPRAQYHAMDATRMDFADDTFDQAISFCVIEHFTDEVAVLRNIARVLKPGGRLLLSADSLSNPEVTAAERATHRRRYAVNTFYTEEILRERLEQAGLELERTRYILTTPLTLALVRLSWRLDDLPRVLAPLRAAAYFTLATLGKPVAGVAERVGGRAGSGLILLAAARKRG